MCIICIDLQKELLSSKEARRHMFELRDELSYEHKLELLRAIWKAEEKEDNAEYNEILEWLREQSDED